MKFDGIPEIMHQTASFNQAGKEDAPALGLEMDIASKRSIIKMDYFGGVQKRVPNPWISEDKCKAY